MPGSASQVLAKFGVVGLLATGLDVVVFNIAAYAVGLGPLTAKTVAFVLATTVAYVGNQRWAFAHRPGDGGPAPVVMFFVINLLGLLIVLACLGTSTYLLGLDSPLAENISANVVGLVLATAFRFWGYQRFVFPAR